LPPFGVSNLPAWFLEERLVVDTPPVAADATNPRASEIAAARTTRPRHDGDALRGRSASSSPTGATGIVLTSFMIVLRAFAANFRGLSCQ